MTRVEVLPAAQNDFDESFEWYFERSPESAVAFSAEIEAAFAVLSADPMRFARIDSKHRECPLDRFPFRIVFRVFDDRIQIVAIAHAKRRRLYWRRRK